MIRVPTGALLCCALLAFAGCGPRSAANLEPVRTVEPPVHFDSARTGLPQSKIWKSQLKFGDINGDGLADFAAISRLADGPYAFIGDGKGSWTDASAGLPRETFCGGGVSFGDLNKDGKTDIAISDHCKGVFAFTGNGSGRWTSASSGLPTVGAEDVALGDFTGDGCLDIAIVTAQEEGIRAYKGNCKGTWQESSDGLPHSDWGNGIVMADMNGDGTLDIVAAYSEGPRVFLGDGKGRWRGASEGLPAPSIHGLYWGIAVGDVNNDGRPDIACGSATGGIEVFIQGEGGRFYNTATTQCAGGPNDTKFCMTDGDCAGGTCATSVCKGTCAAGPRAGQGCSSKEDCPEGSCSQGADFGKACGGTGETMCPGGTCEVVTNLHGLVPMNANIGVAFGDLDKDGNLDLVATGKTNLEEIGGVYGVHPFKGDGKGNWVYLHGTGLPETGKEHSWGVALGDVNGDGVLDIVAAFGDVLPPTWRSGKPKKESEKGTAAEAKDKEKPKELAEKAKGPERGRFGSLEVWTGRLTGK